MNDVIKEFSKLTNEEAYVHIFRMRMMTPIPGRDGEFYGTDQRQYMLPNLNKLIAALPRHAQIFDVGAGAGDVVDFALKNSPCSTTINIEEPNPVLINAYLSKIKNYKNLNQGIAFQGALEDYYRLNKPLPLPKKPQNLILALHMIYHLTDFTKARINPENDLLEAIFFLYTLLAPGGSLFIVYADLLETSEGIAICGLAEKYFRQKHPEEPFADNLINIYKARNKLLGPQGSIIQFLTSKFPNTRPTFYAEKANSHFFGKNIEDIAVLALATELCPSNSQPFEIDKLLFCLDYVTKFPHRIGLIQETGDIPQQGMWRANEPQILATITKH